MYVPENNLESYCCKFSWFPRGLAKDFEGDDNKFALELKIDLVNFRKTRKTRNSVGEDRG